MTNDLMTSDYTHHAMVTVMQVISDADKDSVLPLHMPFKKDTGNSQKWEFPFFVITSFVLLKYVNHLFQAYI